MYISCIHIERGGSWSHVDSSTLDSDFRFTWQPYWYIVSIAYTPATRSIPDVFWSGCTRSGWIYPEERTREGRGRGLRGWGLRFKAKAKHVGSNEERVRITPMRASSFFFASSIAPPFSKTTKIRREESQFPISQFPTFVNKNFQRGGRQRGARTKEEEAGELGRGGVQMEGVRKLADARGNGEWSRRFG